MLFNLWEKVLDNLYFENVASHDYQVTLRSLTQCKLSFNLEGYLILMKKWELHFNLNLSLVFIEIKDWYTKLLQLMICAIV